MTLVTQLTENEEVVKLKGLEWHSGGRGFFGRLRHRRGSSTCRMSVEREEKSDHNLLHAPDVSRFPGEAWISVCESV